MSKADLDARKHRTAEALKVTVPQLADIEAQLRRAGANSGISVARDAHVAKQLHLTPREIDQLRTAIGTGGDRCSPLARPAALALAHRTQSVDAPGPAAFFVRGRDVYHRSATCESIKSATLIQTTVKKATIGRRMCTHCTNELQRDGLQPIPETVSIDLDAKNPRKARATGTAAGTTAAKKRQRAVAEARSRGITVDQLKEERHREAAAGQALSIEAKRLGITVKELRRLRAAKSA